MADNDYNIIKPVDGLQNIAGLTPAKQRQERKRRQNLRREQQKNVKQQHNDLVDQKDLADESANGENGHHSIDYCA